MHRSQPTNVIQMMSVTSRLHCTLKTSSKQPKRRYLYFRLAYRETYDICPFYVHAYRRDPLSNHSPRIAPPPQKKRESSSFDHRLIGYSILQNAQIK